VADLTRAAELFHLASQPRVPAAGTVSPAFAPPCSRPANSRRCPR